MVPRCQSVAHIGLIDVDQTNAHNASAVVGGIVGQMHTFEEQFLSQLMGKNGREVEWDAVESETAATERDP